MNESSATTISAAAGAVLAAESRTRRCKMVARKKYTVKQTAAYVPSASFDNPTNSPSAPATLVIPSAGMMRVGMRSRCMLSTIWGNNLKSPTAEARHTRAKRIDRTTFAISTPRNLINAIGPNPESGWRGLG